MMKRTIAALMITTAGVAHAADWYTMNTGSFGFLFADKESLVAQGNTVKVWVIESPRQYQDTPYVYAQQLMVFDCAQKTYMIKQREIYREDLIPVADAQLNSSTLEIAPDSKEQWLLKFVCNPQSGIGTKIDGVKELMKARAEDRKKGLFDSK